MLVVTVLFINVIFSVVSVRRALIYVKYSLIHLHSPCAFLYGVWFEFFLCPIELQKLFLFVLSEIQFSIKAHKLCKRIIYLKKWKFCYHLLILMSFQTCMTFFFFGTKKKIFWKKSLFFSCRRKEKQQEMKFSFNFHFYSFTNLC